MNYYQTLGLPRTATLAAIRQAYRRLASQYHPDRNKHDHTAPERMAAINAAYACLSDPERKARYDETGEDRSPQEDAAAVVFAAKFKEFVEKVTPELDFKLVQDIGLVEALRQQVREMKKGVPQMIGQMRGTLSKLEAIHRRLIRKPGETTTLLLDAVQGMIDKAKHRLTLAEQGLKDLDEVYEELARWDEEFVRQIMPPRDLSNYFTGDTSVFFRKY